uniref:SH3 domain and tetratricopeptide repeats 1 n=1 Tax=Oryzias latipes TaxID=8090 RepID=A0A3P9MDM6_ORYLA
MSTRWHSEPSWDRNRREEPVDGQPGRRRQSSTGYRSITARAFPKDTMSLKRNLSACEENFPTVLPVLLDVVRGPDRLAADEESQDLLREKLRLLQADCAGVNNLFVELSAELVSINSEEKSIYVTFKTFEELWKFTTYYTIGFLGHCLEDLLLDEKVWLSSLEEDVGVEVSIQEEALNLFHKGILMQEGSLFASCSVSQMFDSSTSGADLYLEQGDIAQFEPPFLGSGWTVLCLADGARGTAPKLALEPVIPFHQWFLKSCPESILVGNGKPACDFPLQFARGKCVATQTHDAEGPDELSLAPGDVIIIVGPLLSCFDWFTGKKEATGEVGLVKTSFVEATSETSDSGDVFLDTREWMFESQKEEEIIKESMDKLKRKSLTDAGQNYKMDTIHYQDSENKTGSSSSPDTKPSPKKLRKYIRRILAPEKYSISASSVTENEVLEDSRQKTCLPCFTVHPVVEGECNTENFTPFFCFLDGQDYKEEFGFLYSLSSDTLSSTFFEGHSDDDELISFLGVARETARKRRLYWMQTRLCFLLGKLCAGKLKFSQARVYFEESLGIPRETFTDLRLLASIYSNLATIYLLQKNRDSFFGVAERLSAFLLGVPDCLKSLEDNNVLKYMLKKAVLTHNKRAEARACYLLAKHHWMKGEGSQVIPYLERLLVVWDEAQRREDISPSHGYLILGELYRKLHLLHLSTSSARRASLQPSAPLSDCLGSMMLVLSDADGRGGTTDQEASVPPQLAPYLYRSLAVIEAQEEEGSPHHRALSHQLTLCLCQLFYKYKMIDHAIRHIHSLIKNKWSSREVPISASDRNSALIWLAWLHIENNQPSIALDILNLFLVSTSEHCKSPQKGVVLNMRGVALRCMGDHRRAAESYQAAVDVCREYEDMPNWAVAQANLGLLFLKAGAKGLARRKLTEALQLFSELSEENHEANFITVLLELGQHYVEQRQLEYGKGCYEWALLLAMKAKLADYQLSATRHLCHLYEHESPDQAQCIIYNQHLIQLLRCSGSRAEEGNALEAISQLYLALGTERAYRAALDYTKSSLMIFIDLGWKEKEAYGWLKAGKIHHLLGQTELVDIYVQAAQDVALSTGHTSFILNLLEAAGDIFWDSCQDYEKAVTFYRDRALPIAVKIGSSQSRLRLCNKLTEVMLALKSYAEAVEFAHTAVDISASAGERLNERVAYHRLAFVYQHLEQSELSEHYYLKALALCPSPLQFDEETLYYVRVYQTLGDITFHHLKDPFDAAGYYHLALAAAMDLGNKRSQLQLCTRLATIYHNFLVDRELSLFFYQKARSFATELNVKRINISADRQRVSMFQHSTQ